MKKIAVFTLALISQAQLAIAESTPHGSHGGAAEHHSAGGLPQLDINTFPSQIFWLFVVFSFLLVFFSRKTLPDISKTIEGRNDRIQTDLESAEKLRKEVEIVHENYESSLNNAREQATQAYKDAEQHIQFLSQKKQEELRDRADKDVAALEKKIESSVQSVMAEMEKIAAQVAADATEKIISIKIDPQDALSVVSGLNNRTSGKTTKAA